MLESLEDYQWMVDFMNHYAPQLDKAAAPIHKMLGTNYFAICRVRGKYQFTTSMITDTKFGEYWFRSGNIFPVPPSNGLYLIDSLRNLFSKEFVDDIRDQYGWDNIAFYVEHRKKYTDIYSFGSDPNHPEVLHNYLNGGTRKLMQFIPYFRHIFKDILLEGEQKSFKYIQDHLAFDHPFSLAQSHLENRAEKYHINQMKDFERNLKLLSNRVFDAVQLASVGLTAEESATILGINHRTVESYLEDAKIKLDVDDKRQLCDMFLTVTS